MTSDLRIRMSGERSAFIESLHSEGFEEGPERDGGVTYIGDVSYRGADDRPKEEAVEVFLPEGFPYTRAQAKRLTGAEGPSWHCSPDGTLCLWANDRSAVDLPWSDGVRFLDRVRLWFESAAREWATEMPALDLERYYNRLTQIMLVYDGESIDFERNPWFKCSADSVGEALVLEVDRFVGRPPVPKARKQKSKHYGVACDIGELVRPPSSWYEFHERLDSSVAERIEAMASMYDRLVVLARYTVRGVRGELPFLLKRDKGYAIEIVGALTPVPTGTRIRTMRGGSLYYDLQDSAVAVVGVGAIGSFAADMLARSGVGSLILLDAERLRPGNSVRHLVADGGYELWQKTDAVKDVLTRYGFVPEGRIESRPHNIKTLDDFEALAERVDLIIDATGSGEASVLMAEAATDDVPVLQVALQREGGVLRVDSFPNTGHREQIPYVASEESSQLEAGCTDPVSRTPAVSVILAAEAVVRTAIDILAKGWTAEPTKLVVLEAQADEPLDRLGVVPCD